MLALKKIFLNSLKQKMWILVVNIVFDETILNKRQLVGKNFVTYMDNENLEWRKKLENENMK